LAGYGGSGCSCKYPAGFEREPEQPLCVEVSNLLLVILVDGHLIKALPSGFHAAVRSVRGEDDAIAADRVRHTQIGLVRRTPTLIYRAGHLVRELSCQYTSIKILAKVINHMALEPRIFRRERICRAPSSPAKNLEIVRQSSANLETRQIRRQE